MKWIPFSALLSATLLGGAAAAPAALYDLANDFSQSSNPNGPWSYGFRPTLTGARTLFDSTSSTATHQVWYAASQGSELAVFKNVSSSTINGVPAGSAAMHPGPNGQFSSLVFTAPESGDLTFTASYGAGDIGNVDFIVQVAGIPVYTALNTATGGTYSQPVPLTVAAGTTVEFLVGTGDGSYAFDSTPVSAQVSFAPPVPEPASMAVLGLGALALLKRRRRAN